MRRAAVIAHAGKSFGGGLPELRRELKRQGVEDPLWVEVPKSRYASKQVERVLGEGIDLLFVWGGDGMVQRCVDAMVDSEAALAIVPAGTANERRGVREFHWHQSEAAKIGTSAMACESVQKRISGLPPPLREGWGGGDLRETNCNSPSPSPTGRGDFFRKLLESNAGSWRGECQLFTVTAL